MTVDDELAHIARAVAALNAPAPCPITRPSRAETLAAIETLLLSDISREARSVIRDIEFEIVHGRKAA